MFPIKHYYPNFLKHSQISPDRKVLSIVYSDCGEWYNSFVKRIHNALDNHHYLPIYRISHGEYIMAIGNKLHKKPSFIEWLKFYYNKILRFLNLRPLFYSGSKDNSHEIISKKEIERARTIYKSGLKEVAANGILAMTFYLNKGFEEYIPSYQKWLQNNNIELTKSNYYSFYMVYCLLTGPDSNSLFKNRKVVAISSFTEAKSEGLKKALNERGCLIHHFINVSPSKAIFDTIDINLIPFIPEIVLIAAGVGSANIILQFKGMKCVIIDAGFALDALAFPEKRWNRPYCIDDATFDISKVNFLPKHIINRLNNKSIPNHESL